MCTRMIPLTYDEAAAALDARENTGAPASRAATSSTPSTTPIPAPRSPPTSWTPMDPSPRSSLPGASRWRTGRAPSSTPASRPRSTSSVAIGSACGQAPSPWAAASCPSARSTSGTAPRLPPARRRENRCAGSAASACRTRAPSSSRACSGRGRLSIVTTAPNVSVAHVHDRMPLILSPGESGVWLGPVFARLADRSAIQLTAEPER